MPKKFYITTAIDYVNDKPHVGHAYEKVCADAIARWNRLIGHDVYFLTGTDENAQKNAQAAKEVNMTVKEFVDKNVTKFIELCSALNLSNDDFIRTTSARHIKAAQYLFDKVSKKGDIYKGKYEGLYCYGCEAFKTDRDLVNGKCLEHNKEPSLIKEEAYFFRMSKYEKQIINLISKSNFVKPEIRKNEVLSRLKSEGLKDLCVSRYKIDWGIPVPNDKEHKIYVWFEALANYISALDYPDGKKFKRYWPADVHLIGKGINWFHSVIWPSILLSVSIKPPKLIYVHGYVNIAGQKMSKSTGLAVDPVDIINKYGTDSLRYFLLREIPFGGDGNFSEDVLIARINNELANDLGNLISRILTLAETNFNSKIKKSKLDKKLTSKLDIKKIQFYMDKYELHNALSEIWRFVNECNKHVNEERIWGMKKEVMAEHLYTILESIRVLSILLSPFIPNTSEEINKQLGVKLGNFKDCKFGLIKNYTVKKGGILFKKIELKEVSKSQPVEVSNMVKFDEWQKLDLRVGEIKEVKEHPNADKLVILKVDIGSKVIQLVAGLKKYYKINDLIGKKVIVFTNLEPIELRGVKSEGMLLVAVDEKNDKVIFLTPEKDIVKGAKIR